MCLINMCQNKQKSQKLKVFFKKSIKIKSQGMLENYSWQFFDIMWLVLLLSQINTVCHCRFTVTAPRSQEAWSKNQRRRSFKPWSSLALSSVHKNEETMLQNWLCNWKLDYVCICANGHAVPRWSTHSYRVLPATLLTETHSNKVVSAPVSKVSPEQAGQDLRSGENCQCFPFLHLPSTTKGKQNSQVRKSSLRFTFSHSHPPSQRSGYFHGRKLGFIKRKHYFKPLLLFRSVCFLLWFLHRECPHMLQSLTLGS